MRRAALAAHVVASISWIGTAGAFLVLAVAGLRSDDAQTLRSVYPAMDLITTAAIVPVATAAFATGLLQAVGTPWGLLRHYWVVAKLVITAFALGVLVQEIAPIDQLADVARRGDLAVHTERAERTSLVVHSGVGIAVLLVPTVLSIYKPRGLTRLGQRKAGDTSRSPA